MYLKWKGNTIQARETLSKSSVYSESFSNPLLVESQVLMDIYDGKYNEALSFLLPKNFEYIYIQFYVDLKTLLCARLYSLLDKSEMAHASFDSARVKLEAKILENPFDSRLYSALGIAYAGLGMKEKAIIAGKRGVELMPITKEAYRGVFRAEDLARIYVMVGEYNSALELINQLLNIPSRLSVKLLMLDPAWKPLWNLPEFKRLIYSASTNS
jgi:tetratricopeptide (TPR) repeat protein